jgi:hypothetical protein
MFLLNIDRLKLLSLPNLDIYIDVFRSEIEIYGVGQKAIKAKLYSRQDQSKIILHDITETEITPLLETGVPKPK